MMKSAGFTYFLVYFKPWWHTENNSTAHRLRNTGLNDNTKSTTNCSKIIFLKIKQKSAILKIIKKEYVEN